MSHLAAEVPIFPQVLVNVVVENGSKQAAMQDEEMWRRIREIEAELGEAGRVLVRASGTEPLIRIMLEGQDADAIGVLAVSIAKILEKIMVGGFASERIPGGIYPQTQQTQNACCGGDARGRGDRPRTFTHAGARNPALSAGAAAMG